MLHVISVRVHYIFGFQNKCIPLCKKHMLCISWNSQLSVVFLIVKYYLYIILIPIVLLPAAVIPSNFNGLSGHV
jgi:hypothetical protein